MNETGNKYALAALKDKRATLAGELAQLRNKLAWAESQLKHLDATIGIFEPNLDPDSIPNKHPRKRVKLFRQGELGLSLPKTRFVHIGGAIRPGAGCLRRLRYWIFADGLAHPCVNSDGCAPCCSSAHSSSARAEDARR